MAKTKKETVKVTLTGQGAISPISTYKGTTYFQSYGTTNLFGATTFDGHVSYSATKSRSIKYTNGVAVLADLKGDQIDVDLSGSGHAAADYPFTLKGSVIGGTGTYAGAAGSVTGKGTLSATGAFSIQLTLTLKHT